MNQQYSRGYRDPGIPSMQSRLTQGVEPMAYDTTPNAQEWQPTVLYLLGLIVLEFAVLAALRYLPKIRG